MAIKYVSQTATNGYEIGSDANNGSTKSLAYLTLDAAITGAAASDTVILNDGTYTAATFFDVAKALTINPENAGLVTLKCTGAVGQVIRVGVAGNTITLGALIIDAELNAAASCLAVNGITARGVTLNGTTLKNPGTTRFAVESINSGQVLTFAATDIVVQSQNGGGGVYLLVGAAALVDIDGLSADNSTGAGASTNTRCPVYINANAATATHRIRRVTGVWKTTAASVSSAFIRTSGTRGVIERNRGMRVTGGDTNGCIIKCENTSGVQADSLVIRNNQGSNETTGGFLILVGADGAGANDNKTNYPAIYGNDVYGTDAATVMHGIFIGNSKNGVITRNTVKNAAIPIIAKLTSEAAYIVDNDVIGPYTGTSGCLRGKGATNLQIVGNRVVMYSGKTNPAVVIDRDPTIPTVSTGCSVVGNTAYSSVSVPSMASVGGAADASVATFVENNYRAPAYSAGAFVYQASSYNTVALWSAAQEKTALDVEPTKSDLGFWRDAYVPMLQSALSRSFPCLLSVF